MITFQNNDNSQVQQAFPSALINRFGRDRARTIVTILSAHNRRAQPPSTQAAAIPTPAAAVPPKLVPPLGNDTPPLPPLNTPAAMAIGKQAFESWSAPGNGPALDVTQRVSGGASAVPGMPPRVSQQGVLVQQPAPQPTAIQQSQQHPQQGGHLFVSTQHLDAASLQQHMQMQQHPAQQQPTSSSPGGMNLLVHTLEKEGFLDAKEASAVLRIWQVVKVTFIFRFY